MFRIALAVSCLALVSAPALAQTPPINPGDNATSSDTPRGVFQAPVAPYRNPPSMTTIPSTSMPGSHLPANRLPATRMPQSRLDTGAPSVAPDATAPIADAPAKNPPTSTAGGR